MHSISKTFLSALAVGTLAACPVFAQDVAPAHTETVKRIVDGQPFKTAVDALQKDHDRWIGEVIKLTEIPAPPFKEEARAKAYAEMLKAHGLSDVEIDAEGNAMGVRKGTGGGPLVVVSAHLDTVFPEGTDVKVKREGTRLAAPGVGDDSSGLATLLSIVRAMDAAGIKTKSDIVFLGDVGEEGLGDLRGVRYFFTKGKYKDQVKYFFSLDGSSTTRLTNCGVGSKRYRVTYKGPGGHSFGAFGLVNPMTAMAQTVVELYKVQTPTKPKTTYSASVTQGGTSVNCDPERGLDGVRHALRGREGAGPAREALPGDREPVPGDGELRPLHQGRNDHRGHQARRRPTRRPDGRRRRTSCSSRRPPSWRTAASRLMSAARPTPTCR